MHEEKRLAEMVESLKASGNRITPQRLAILQSLVQDTGHPSVESVFEGLRHDYPSMSLATVYKTIVLLKQLNQIQEVRTDEVGVRYDGRNPKPHIHVVCRNCKLVIDVPEEALEQAFQDVSELADFQITGHSLVFYGICGACEEKTE